MGEEPPEPAVPPAPAPAVEPAPDPTPAPTSPAETKPSRVGREDPATNPRVGRDDPAVPTSEIEAPKTSTIGVSEMAKPANPNKIKAAPAKPKATDKVVAPN